MNFDLSKLDGYYERLTLVGVNFKEIKCHCEILDVFGCTIDNIGDLINSNFEEVVIREELYEKYSLDFNNCGRRVVVLEDNGQFISKKVGF